jgi:hypothetical protein
MISIRELSDRRLAWYRPGVETQTYELRPDKLPAVTVAVFRDQGRIKLPISPKRNFLWSLLESFGYEALSAAEAETAEGTWRFLRRQSSAPTVTVRLPGDPPNVAEFSDERLVLPGGGSLRSGQMPWSNVCTWHAQDDRPVMHLRPRIWGFWPSPGIKAYVEFEPAAKDCAELPLLVLLSWYEYLADAGAVATE